MKNLLTSLLCLTAVLAGYPADNGQSFFTKAKIPPTHVGSKSATTHSVTVKLIFDNSKYDNWGMIRVAGEDFYDGFFIENKDDSGLTGTIELPEGVYTFFTEYDQLDENTMFGRSGYAWILIEDVNVNNDNVVVEMKAADAKNRLTFNCTTPDGSEPVLPTTHYTGNPEGPDKIEGNISGMVISNDIFSNGVNIYGRGGQGDFRVISDVGGRSFDMARVLDIRVNNISDKACVQQSRMMAATDGFYVTVSKPVYGVSSSADGEYSSNYDTAYKLNFIPSTLGKNTDKEVFTPSYSLFVEWIYPDDKKTSSRPVSSPAGDIFIAGLDNAPDDLYKFAFRPGYTDYGRVVYDDETGEEMGMMTWTTQAQRLWFDADKKPVKEYVQLSSLFTPTDEKTDLDYAPMNGHPAFSHSVADSRHTDGDSQPSLLAASYIDTDYETDEDVWYISYLPIGRIGEQRLSDTATLKSEQKELDNGLTEYSLTVANNEIDGIAGTTTAVLRFGREKDIYPPVVQLVQFRTNDNIVTDRFNEANDGRILIAAGDFNQHRDPEKWWWWYDTDDTDITVEYSPLDKADWKELPVEEQPELYVREFGQLFEGSLGSIRSGEYTGWYDLRITLTDNDGSFSQQTISPAFKINQSTGITGPKADNRTLIVHGQTATAADGTMINAYLTNGTLIATGHGSLNLAGLAPGVYIISAGDSVTKYIAR